MSRRFQGLIALALIAAACSGGGDDASPGVATLAATSSTTVDVDPGRETEEQVLKLVQCLRDEGINVPDPTITGDGNIRFSPPADFAADDLADLQAAVVVCEEFIEGLDIGVENIDTTTIADNLLIFADCMRDNGFDIRDPDFSLLETIDGSFPPGGPFGDLDISDPDFIAALPECQQFLNNLGTPPTTQPSG